MIDEDVLHELAVVAQELTRRDPDATWCDLLKLYLSYKAGQDYSEELKEPPDDEEIVKLHLSCKTPRQIAEILDDDESYVRWILLQYGFSPFTGFDTSPVRQEKTISKLVVELKKHEEAVKNGFLT